MSVDFYYIKQLIIFQCLLLLPLFQFAQNKTIDSLNQLLQNARHDTTKISLNYEIAEKLRSYDIPAADKYLEAGYTLAKAGESKYHIASYFRYKGHLLFDMAKYNESLRHYDSAIILYNQLIKRSAIESTKQADKYLKTYKFDKTDCLTGKGLLAAKFYKYEESIQYYLEAIGLIDDLPGNEKNDYIARLYINIASNYYELEQFENSLAYDKRLLPYLNQKTNIDLYVIGYLFIADDFSTLSQFDSSSAYLEKVRPIVFRMNKPSLDVRFYYILGTIFRKKKDWNNALVSYQKANDAAQKMKDDFQILNSGEGIAACYLNLGDLLKAREMAILVLNESNRVNVPLGKVQSLQLLTEIEEKSGNIDKAYNYQKQWMQVSDSIKKRKSAKTNE